MKLLVFLFLLLPSGAGAECIYLANYRGDVIVLEESDLSQLYSIRGRGGPFGMVVDGGFAYTNQLGGADGTNGHLFLPGTILGFDVARQTVTAEFPTGRGNLGLAYANGKLYAPNAEDRTVTIVDPVRSVTQTLQGFGEFTASVAATPDGSRVFVGDLVSGTVYVIDTATDSIVLSFSSEPLIVDMLATDDEVFINGDGLVAFGRQANGDYVRLWITHFGYSNALAIAGQQLFAASRGRFLGAISLQPPHDTTVYILGTELGDDLMDLTEHNGWLYVAGEEGLFRFWPADATTQLIYKQSLRQVQIAPCPGFQSTVPGDANCDGLLTAADVDATARAMYDAGARATCDADCNRDGQVTSADLSCLLRAR